MLSAGGSFRWFRDALAQSDLAEANAKNSDVYDLLTAQAVHAPAGSEGLIFLPYLSGERTPHPDPDAQFGESPKAEKAATRAVPSATVGSAPAGAGTLSGHATLKRQHRMCMYAALEQRTATRFTMKPMDRAESAGYPRPHLALAGRAEQLFADAAVARLHRVSNGLPRALNNAATAALIAAAAAGQDLVDDACAKKAVAELTRD